MLKNSQLEPKQINSLLWLFILYCGSIGFAYLVPHILHGKFYIDSYSIIHSPSAIGIGVGSYPSTKFLLSPILAFLELLGADVEQYSLRYDLDFMLVNTVFIFLFLATFTVTFLSKPMKWNVIGIFTLFMMIVIYAPYYGVPNKEVIPYFITFLFVLKVVRNETRNIPIQTVLLIYSLLICIYSVYGRFYYLIFVILFLTHWFFRKSYPKILLVYFLGCLGVLLVFDKSFFSIIYYARPSTIIDITNTWIHYYFPDDQYIGFMLNRGTELFRLLFPFELLLSSPEYLPFVFFQLMTTYLVFLYIVKRKYNITYISAIGVLAFTISQAVFEPDFGSYFRHKIFIFPFLYILFYQFAKDYKGTVFGKKITFK